MPEARGEKIVTSVPRSFCSRIWFCLQALADFIIRHLQTGARRQRGLVLHGLGLVLAEAVQVLGLGGVMAVAIDDHEVRR